MGQNRGRDGAKLTSNKRVLTFRGCYLGATFGENRSRNVIVRVHTYGHTQRERQTEFVICPMLYATAMGQIKTAQSTTDETLVN